MPRSSSMSTPTLYTADGQLISHLEVITTTASVNNDAPMSCQVPEIGICDSFRCRERL